ncbi:flavin reductase family protein [Saccharicrinis aurantiacus]|uniref:flavin reductase family protein n=1 Tax=Saccharicrinis aurantiacus TaxID=1849719 RepID=UPI00094F8E52|nr:flavin reductase family protein [Saccharicrinis aurantiacus]
MAKVDWRPGNMVYPLPAVMVTVGDKPENYNIITIAWTGTICSDPAMCYISVRKARHSHAILMETKEFVINLTTKDLAYATDWCGVKSGRKYDKFKEMKLTAGKASIVKAPIIEESPISLECKVTQVIELGTHDMFMAEIVNVKADDKYLDDETGAFSLDSANPICYSHGHYFEVGDKLGKFGFSVQKKKKKKTKK